MTESDNTNSHNLQSQHLHLLQALEVRDKLIIDKIEQKLKELENKLTTLITQETTKTFASNLEGAVPKIITELKSTSEEYLKRIADIGSQINDNYINVFGQNAKVIENTEDKIKQISKDLDTVDKKKIKSFFFGIIISVIISVVASVSSAYYMMQSFPTRVVINNPENIILQDSEVSLWGTDNVKVLKKNKK